MTTHLVEAYMLRTGDRFRSMGATFRADSVGLNCIVATVLDGAYRPGSQSWPVTPGQTAYIPTGGHRSTLKVERLGGDDDLPPEAA